jgi:hypothetical protein
VLLENTGNKVRRGLFAELPGQITNAYLFVIERLLLESLRDPGWLSLCAIKLSASLESPG